MQLWTSVLYLDDQLMTLRQWSRDEVIHIRILMHFEDEFGLLHVPCTCFYACMLRSVSLVQLDDSLCFSHMSNEVLLILSREGLSRSRTMFAGSSCERSGEGGH